jgi:PAS domain S-box-containing protein
VALRDLLVISLAVASLLWLGAATGLIDAVTTWIAERFPGRVAEALVGLALLGIGFGVFGILRWRSAGDESVARANLDGRYRTLVENLPAVTHTWDPRDRSGTSTNAFVSPQAKSVLGFTVESWTADPGLWRRQIHDEDRTRVVTAFEQALRSGEPFTVEYRFLKADGSMVWIREDAVVVGPNGDQGPSHIQGQMTDVTEHKRAQEQIAQAEARYRMLVERVPAVTYTWDATYRSGEAPAPYISPQVRQLLGYGQDEFGDPALWSRLVHPDDYERVMADWQVAERDGTAFRAEYRMFTRSGDVVWIADEAVPVGRDERGHPLYQGVMFDVTERKTAEEQMRFAENRYRSLVEHMPIVTYVNDLRSDPEHRYVSPGVERLLGYSQAEWLADPDVWQRVVHPEDLDRVLEDYRRSVAAGETWDAEYRMVAKDGAVVWVHDEARIVDRGPSPQRSVWQGVCVNITDRKEAELRLRDAEETYRTLVEQLPVVVYQDAVDDMSTALYISPQYERMFGFPPEARLADPKFWIQHLHPDDRERVLEESKRTNETGDPFSIEYRFIGRDGRVVRVRDEAVLLRHPDGTPRHWQGVLVDVTRAKLAEEALSRRDSVLEAAGFAAGRLLKSLEWEAAVPEVLERLGRASAAGRVHLFENVQTDDGELAMRLRHQWAADGVPALEDSGEPVPYSRGHVRWQAALGAGRTIHGHTRNFPAAERVGPLHDGVRSRVLVPVSVGDEWWGFLGFDDLAEEREWPAPEIEALKTAADTLGAAIGRARAEARRTEAELRYRTLVETIPAVTYIQAVGAGAPLTYISPQLERLTGYTLEEWRSSDFERWVDSLHPDDRAHVLEADERSERTGEPFVVEYRQRHKDGHWIWIHDEASLVHDDEGRPVFWQGIRFDITERRQAEEQLREAEARYRAIVEHVPAAIYVDHPNGSMQSDYVSPQVRDIMGVSPERYIEEPSLWLDLMTPEFREEMRRSYLEAIEEQRSWQGEYRIVTPDGREVWVHDETTFVTDDDGVPLFLQGVLFDITERKAAEQALRDSERREREAAERLRALDEMKNTFLAAVSHELRSPLTSILGLSLTLDQQRLSAADRRDLTRRVAQNARKLDRLLKDLLDIDRLSRGNVTPKLRPTDVGALARGAIDSLELGERRVIVEAEEVLVPVDAAKIERVLENLVMNAVRHTDDEVTIWVRVWAGAGGAFVAVEDDGPGVPDDLQSAIFEPFRQGPTTAPHSPGTGIGLSLVAMFTELHGGRAWVEERVGGGASFRVFLPGEPPADPRHGNGHQRQRRTRTADRARAN